MSTNIQILELMLKFKKEEKHTWNVARALGRLDPLQRSHVETVHIGGGAEVFNRATEEPHVAAEHAGGVCIPGSWEVGGLL